MTPRRSCRPYGRAVHHLSLTILALTAGASASSISNGKTGPGAAGPAKVTPGPRFVNQPGRLELTGQMIVRPLQPAALAAKGLDPVAAAQARARAGNRLAANTLKFYPEVDEYVVSVPAGLDENAYYTQLMATGDYQYAHPNYICFPTDVPNDPMFGSQWHHVNMQAAAAWDITHGDSDYITAFTDTGIDLTHPDLMAHRVHGFNAASDLEEDDGGDVSDINGHGTHVSGCAGAIGNNGVGVAGANWNSRLMMCRVTNDPGGGAYYDDLFQAARWAADHGAKSISTSYTGVESDGVETTGAYVRSKGALYLYAADNYAQDHSNFDWPDVIVVGASDQNDQRAGFSSYGLAVDVFTPGVDILSSTNGGGYAAWSGTSMATPVTNGVCALIWSINKNFTPEMVESFLEHGCDDMGDPGEDGIYGWGRTNSLKSVQLAVAANGPQAPYAIDDYAQTILPDTAVINALANDFDVNGDPISIVDFDAHSVLGGNIYLDNNKFYYSPPKQAGDDTFTYTITDNVDGSDTATVHITLIDPANFRNPDATGPTDPGANVDYYALQGPAQLPDFGALDSYASEVVADINYPSTDGVYAGSGRADEVGAVYTGYINVPKTDVYTLYTNSDDGSKLWIGDQLIVNNDGLHGMQEIGGAIGLKKGPHKFRAEFFENGGGAGMIVSLAGGGLGKAPISADLYIHGSGCSPDLDGNGALDLFDFLSFVNLFNAHDPSADWDANGSFDLFDFLGYVNSFNAGC